MQPPERQIVVGICAMAKKSKSKPMKEILERLCLFKYITVVTFEEEVILNEPVENWPLCDCLISFHSKGEQGHVCFVPAHAQFIHTLPTFMVWCHVKGLYKQALDMFLRKGQLSQIKTYFFI